jgi:NAD(P)-dependent dehydrogenase (short-subunit alcohol dehydrogenase family)
MTHWTAADIPDLSGRTAVVTGANSGLGLVASIELARHGASLTMACRDPQRAARALQQVFDAAPGADVRLAPLDLADLGSVRAFADSWSSDHPEGLSLLINNAGVMAIPRGTTADGFERQLGTNHLGHFALTGLLLPALLRRPTSRVVTVSSNAHKMGRMNFEDLQSERSYRRWRAYGQSKLANLLFAAELQRRADEADAPLLSLAAHPGYAATNLTTAGPASGSSLAGAAMRVFDRILGQSAEQGALPELYAATAPGVPGGVYVGPDGFGEQRGYPTVVQPTDAARDQAAAARLWEESERLTGVVYDLAAR